MRLMGNAVPQLCVACIFEKCVWPSIFTAPIAMSDSRKCTTTALTVVWRFPLACCMRLPRRLALRLHRQASCWCDTDACVSDTLVVRALWRGGTPAPPAHHSALRPWLAATLSLICGLGQLYNGQIVKGVVLLICGIAAVAAWQFLLGKMLVLFLWLYAISDAYLVARRTLPRGPQRQHAQP